MMEKRKTEKVTLESIAKTLGGMATKVDIDKAIENLAIITNNGFANTVSKEDFSEFKEEMTEFKKNTERTLFNLDSHARTTNERLDAIEKTLEPLMLASGAMQRELREHERRLSHVERKVGVVIK